MSYANRQHSRLKSALYFYRKRQWEEAEIADKAGSLAIRLLALDVTHKEQTGMILLAPKLRESLLRLVLLTEPDWEDFDASEEDQ